MRKLNVIQFVISNHLVATYGFFAKGRKEKKRGKMKKE